ncbi:hypothetical protein Trydic_g4942 [Trypoxylus dichotomus]
MTSTTSILRNSRGMLLTSLIFVLIHFHRPADLLVAVKDTAQAQEQQSDLVVNAERVDSRFETFGSCRSRVRGSFF